MDPVNEPAKFELRSLTRSWDNRRYFKTLGGPWLRRDEWRRIVFVAVEDVKGELFLCKIEKL